MRRSQRWLSALLFTPIPLLGSIASALSIPVNLDRRSAIAHAVSVPFLLLSDATPAGMDAHADDRAHAPPPAAAADLNPCGVITVILDRGQNAGLELRDTAIGTPPRPVTAVRAVRPGGAAARAGAAPGMILPEYAEAQAAVRALADGPRPIALRLYNLALGGDAVGDLGRSLVSPADALALAERVSRDDVTVVAGGSQPANARRLAIATVREARGDCAVRSRRGDTMQIRYDARVGDRSGVVYDSSDTRGTGQPYAYMLGNGDVLRGVDLGTYDMCPGEVRELTIPPELGYRGGSRLYPQIPPNSPLFWRVELVELNFIKEGSNDVPREEIDPRD